MTTWTESSWRWAKGLKSVVSNSPELARNGRTNRGFVGSHRCRFRSFVVGQIRRHGHAGERFFAFPGTPRCRRHVFHARPVTKDTENELWGGQETPKGSVVACDFYNSSAIATLSDEDIVKTLTKDLLPEAVEAFRDAGVVDFASSDIRKPFRTSPRALLRPPLQTSVPNVAARATGSAWVTENSARKVCAKNAPLSAASKPATRSCSKR